jgi:RNA polymerase sigma-70 factor (ECF subfamily)
MNNTEEADEVLIGRYAQGHAAAFDQLYRRHESGVWRYLERNVFDQATSDELLQDVWLALARNAVGFEPGMRFRTRLFTLAHDRMAVLLRTRSSKGAPATTATRPAVSEDPASALSRAFGQLPRDQREALLLQLEGQLSVGHIAEATESTVDAVEGRLNTAKLKLLELLNEKGHVPSNPDPLSEVDSLYRRLSALDPGHPGEWVRRKVQAYAAQQAAERALRANATAKSATAKANSSSDTATSRLISAPIAEEKAASKPWLLPVAIGAVAAVGLVGFLIFRNTGSETPKEALAPAPSSQPEPATTEIAQAPATPSSESVFPAPQPSAPPPPPAPSPPRQSTAPTSVARTPAGPSPPAPVVSPRSAGAPAAQSLTRARLARQSAAPTQSSPTGGDRAETAAPAPRPAPPADPAPASSNAVVASADKQPSSAPPPAATPAAVTPAPPQAAATQPTPTSATSAAASTPPDQLWAAAKSGDMPGLQAALASSPDVNALDASGRSALILAIQNNHLRVVQALLAHGANPNTPDAHGYTPMRVARVHSNVEILNALENKLPH